MKIRNPYLLRAVGWLLACLIRLVIRSLRLEVAYLGSARGPVDLPSTAPRYLYAIWHEHLLLPAARFGHPDLAVLISKHADGQLLGSLIDAMGMAQVTGSTNRGGLEAVRQLLRNDANRKHLAVTPDGPRGPRRRVHEGIGFIASRTGFQIVPIGVGHRRPWRLKSWDRFAIPKPFAMARIVCGAPMVVPAALRAAELEQYRHQIESEMLRLTELAQQWADTGRRPQLIPTSQEQSSPRAA
jgi:hypothetical protein